MASQVRALCLIAGLVLTCAGCGPSEEARRQQARLEALKEAEAERLEAARQQAARVQREREVRERRDRLVKQYARLAGGQIMKAIGGGQDLIVTAGTWTFDEGMAEFEIPMDVSFNGALFRSNNYRVRGLLTVREDGGHPRFARLEANQNYRDVEDTLTVLGVGMVILNDLNAQ